jgi:FtsH-binding integral membrane protein
MVEARYRSVAQNQAGARVREIDEGLRSYMLRVYNIMALGVAVTALKWVLFAGIKGLGVFAPRLIFSGNAMTAHAAYWGYAVMWGLLIGPLMAFYLGTNPGLVVQAFGVTAATFMAMSLIGYTTKKDLSGFGTFFMMATIGILIAMLANVFFFQSAMMGFVTSIIVVLLFSAITAYETQQIKEMYVEGDAVGIAQGKAIFGAFMLYGTFVTLFVNILQILGFMQNE